MSLHDSASQVQSAGRGEDKVLVHMTPGEVGGLQALAMAHGGSLTINPHTGLPEASFLRSLLPTLIGFGLAPLTGGLSAALITGAGYTAATGSLKKGIMAGLGAYGGAGLASGLNAVGAQAASTGSGIGVNAANMGKMGVQANTNMLAGPATFADDVALNSGITFNPNAALGSGFNANTVGLTNTGATVGLNTGYTGLGPQLNAMAPSATSPAITNIPRVAPPMGGPTVNVGGTGGVPAFNQSMTPKYPTIESRTPALIEKPYIRSEVLPSDPALAQPKSLTGPYRDYMSQVGQGAKNVYAGGMQGLKDLSAAMPDYSIAAGLGGTAGTYAIERQEKAEEAMRNRKKESPGMIRPYEFSYGPTDTAFEPYSGSAERTYFQPSFTALTPYEAPGPEYAAEGGLMGYAVGGPVEQMAAMNSVGANTGYPMANINTPVYSNPTMQRPEATNVIAPSADAGVSAYSGEARFANGGPAFMGPVGSGHYGAGSYSERARLPGSNAPRPSSATPQNQSSGAAYSYNPSTQQFTQTAGGSGISGGIATPVRQPTSPAQPLIPNINIPAYQTPEQQLGLGGFYDYMNQQLGGLGGYSGYAAGGGVSTLGDYSDGGRLLKGPGDGVSDSIPASIGNRQPARLADGEFVVPARIVSEIGNGSTEAGARKLYAMMDRVQKARRKTVGKNQVAKNTKAERLLPA